METASDVASKLTKLFCHEEMITHNGPHSTSPEFKQLMKEFNIKHRLILTYHSQSNREIEMFYRTLKKATQTAVAAGKNWHITLKNFLRNYRANSHAPTGIASSNLMFNLNIKDKISSVKNPEIKTHHSTPKPHGTDNKAKTKFHSDRAHHATPHDIQSQDGVLVVNSTKYLNKFQPAYCSKSAIKPLLLYTTKRQ